MSLSQVAKSCQYVGSHKYHLNRYFIIDFHRFTSFTFSVFRCECIPRALLSGLYTMQERMLDDDNSSSIKVRVKIFIKRSRREFQVILPR